MLGATWKVPFEEGTSSAKLSKSRRIVPSPKRSHRLIDGSFPAVVSPMGSGEGEGMRRLARINDPVIERDIRQSMPVTGSFIGPPGAFLNMSVAVSITA